MGEGGVGDEGKRRREMGGGEEEKGEGRRVQGEGEGQERLKGA